MARTMIDIDEEALAEAARVLGTTTKKDTVNTALREAVARLRRLDALNRMQEMADRGDIDLEFFDEMQAAEKKVVRRAQARAGAREVPRLDIA